ncbi:MAG: hypothetical protein PHN19_03695 [Patescibacteria group bacterium]|nr:hypothetical protein [Patescibacteria group bacterium]
MSLIGQIFFGLLGIGLGVLITIKSEWLINNVGSPGFAQKYFGTFGGGRLFWQLLGILVAAFATLYMTGFLQNTLPNMLKGLFGGGL